MIGTNKRLGVYAATAGFVLMVFELAAARLLAPTIGSSMYVWTSVIGIIVMALSLGFWYGGRIADMRHRLLDISLLFGAISASIVMMLVIGDALLESLSTSDMDARLKAVIASLVLFAPTSFFTGMVSPYLAKLNVTSLKTSGRAIANLDALNSIGGIFGTFLAGFVLFGYFGVREVIITLAITSAIMSWSIAPREQTNKRLVATGFLALLILLSGQSTDAQAIDTPTMHYSIERHQTGVETQVHLTTGPMASQSGIILGRPDELIFWYTQQMARIVEEKSIEAGDKILVLGGGAYTLPRYLAEKYPEAQIDVVEIDPELIQIAREHFEYNDPKNVTSYAVDARAYVNTTKEQYDVVLVDVFSHDQTPFTFVTKEYGQAMRRITKPDGIVAVNIIAGSEGACREVLDASLAPFLANFAQGAVLFRAPEASSSNIMAAFGPTGWEVPDGYMLAMDGGQKIFTDNFAPTERLASTCRSY